jgi:hypothetical protein
MITYGLLFNGDRSYLRDPWNVLDALAVIFTIITLTPIAKSFNILKIVRIVRPLRVVQ